MKSIFTFFIFSILAMYGFSQKLIFEQDTEKAKSITDTVPKDKVLLLFQSELELSFESTMEFLKPPIREGNLYKLLLSQRKCIITVRNAANNASSVDISFGQMIGNSFPVQAVGTKKYFHIKQSIQLFYTDITEKKRSEGANDNQMLYEKDALIIMILDPPDLKLDIQSSIQIHDIKRENNRYRLYLTPANQTLCLKHPDLDSTYIQLNNLLVKDVRYFHIALPYIALKNSVVDTKIINQADSTKKADSVMKIQNVTIMQKVNRLNFPKFASLGVSAAGFGLGALFYFSATKVSNDYNTAQSDATQKHDDLERNNKLTAVAFGIGAVCLIPTIYFFGKQHKIKKQLNVAYIPGHHQNSIALNIRF
jgi:hypothetical protein